VYQFPAENMTKHLISLVPMGFLCSCGERTESAERPTAVASRHQLAALLRDAMNGSGPLVTNCLACNAESLLPTTSDDAIVAYAAWVGSPCPSCGKKPVDVAGAPR
jgi:hypothetical protein